MWKSRNWKKYPHSHRIHTYAHTVVNRHCRASFVRFSFSFFFLFFSLFFTNGTIANGEVSVGIHNLVIGPSCYINFFFQRASRKSLLGYFESFRKIGGRERERERQHLRVSRFFLMVYSESEVFTMRSNKRNYRQSNMRGLTELEACAGLYCIQKFLAQGLLVRKLRKL